jgi:hypothetical protein
MADDFHRVKVERKRFFYDAQIARILIQVGTKCFGGWQVMTGYQTDGSVRMLDVPVVFAGWSRMAQQLIEGASDNAVMRVPVMSYSLGSMTRKTAEVRDPRNIQQHVIRRRKRDPDGNLIVNEPGELVVVERYMPVPYLMELELSIWTSNYDQMMQLIEQISSSFNPDQEFSIGDSPADWSSPTSILHGGSFRLDENVVAENPDGTLVCRVPFTVTARISLPARVYDATLIHEIQVPIHEMEDFGYMYFGDNIDLPQFPTLNKLTIIATEQQIIDHEGQ